MVRLLLANTIPSVAIAACAFFAFASVTFYCAAKVSVSRAFAGKTPQRLLPGFARQLLLPPTDACKMKKYLEAVAM